MQVLRCLGRAAVVHTLYRGPLGQKCRRTLHCSAAMENCLDRQQAVICSLPNDETLTIKLNLAGQQRFMCRAKNEKLEKTLSRIQMNAMPKAKRQKKTKNAPPPEPSALDIDVLLLSSRISDSKAVPGNTLNEDAWLDGRVLKVGSTTYDIIVNPPTVVKIIVHGLPMVGFLLCAVPQMNFAEDSVCLWQWSREKGGAQAGAWEDIPRATEKVYNPQAADLGMRLRVHCTPGCVRKGTEQAVLGQPLDFTTAAVQLGPSLRAGANRHPLTPAALPPPGVRVVTYNILADQYVATAYAQNVLFAYCPPQFRMAEYRRPLVLQELLGFNADIICLQEVDEKAFTQFLHPHLEYAGFEGHYTNKAGETREGSATFFRKARYQLIARRDVSLKDLISSLMERGELASLHSQLMPIICSSTSLMHNIQKVSTIAQLTLIAPVNASASDGPLCVANTHLFFHPRANHIRTIHTAAIMAETQQLIREVQGSAADSGRLAGRDPAVLFCGDLNSGVNKGMPGALELLATGKLAADFWDWDSGRTFRYVKDTEEQAESIGDTKGNAAAAGKVQEEEQVDVAFRSADLTIPFQLATADGFKTPFTNFVRGYQGALDYVWYEPARMAVRQEIPLPSEAELEGWIPSERFPSDHLSVVFDLEWRQPEANAKGASNIGVHPNRGSTASASNSRVFPANQQSMSLGLWALRNRGVVAVPTDTLYGLAASAESAEGVRRVYAIKRRKQGLPLAICVASSSDVARYGEVGHLPTGLLDRLLPGPVTLLLHRKQSSPLTEELNPGLDTIGVRVPASPFIQQLCSEFGSALALTSANLSGTANSLTVRDFSGLWPQCAAIYDGGRIQASPEGSTIVDLSKPGSFHIKRKGIAFQETVSSLQSFGIESAEQL